MKVYSLDRLRRVAIYLPRIQSNLPGFCRRLLIAFLLKSSLPGELQARNELLILSGSVCKRKDGCRSTKVINLYKQSLKFSQNRHF
jgi:hypothetical protein